MKKSRYRQREEEEKEGVGLGERVGGQRDRKVVMYLAWMNPCDNCFSVLYFSLFKMCA